jgi:hypothetical protein
MQNMDANGEHTEVTKIEIYKSVKEIEDQAFANYGSSSGLLAEIPSEDHFGDRDLTATGVDSVIPRA